MIDVKRKFIEDCREFFKSPLTKYIYELKRGRATLYARYSTNEDWFVISQFHFDEENKGLIINVKDFWKGGKYYEV